MNSIEKYIKEHPESGIFFFVLLLTGFATAFQEITRIDVRFALMVQDMAKHGMGVFATVNGEEYADYPSAYMGLSFLTTFGGRFLNLWSLTLPTQICAALCCVLIYRIGESLRKYAGLAGVILLLLSWTGIELFTQFSIDLPVALAGIWLCERLLLHREKLLQNLFCFAFALFAVFLIRGPLGILMTGGAVGGMLLAQKRWKEILLFGTLGFVMTLADITLGYTLIRLQGGEKLLKLFYDWQIGSRLSGGKYGFFYYFTNGIASYAPVTVAGGLAVLLLKKKILEEKYIAFLGFILLPLLMLGLPSCKHLRYMTVTLPAFAVLGGLAVLALPENFKSKVPGLVSRYAQNVHLLLIPAALIVFFAAGYEYVCFQTAVLLLSALLLRKIPNPLLRLVLTLIGIFFFAALPLCFHSERSAPFVRRAEFFRSGIPGARIAFYQVRVDHDDLKYLLHTQPEKRKDIRYFYSFRSSPRLREIYPGLHPDKMIPELKSGDLILCRSDFRKDLKELVQKHNASVIPCVEGRMGHRKYTVFQLAKQDSGK